MLEPAQFFLRSHISGYWLWLKPFDGAHHILYQTKLETLERMQIRFGDVGDVN